MSKYNERRRRRDIPIRIPEEPEEINETKKANEQLDLRMKKLLIAQKDYQKDTDKRFGEIGSRLTAIEQALGVKKTKTSSTEETRQKDAPKREPTDNGSKRASEPQVTGKEGFGTSDGPHVVWWYWDYKTYRWLGPKLSVGTALAAVGHDHSQIRKDCVWIKDGRIDRKMTMEEIEKYMP